MGYFNSIRIKVTYHNMGKGNKAQYACLENYRQKELDILFVCEIFIDKKRYRTITIMGYELVVEFRVTSKVAIRR